MCIVLTESDVEALGLRVGDAVEVMPADAEEGNQIFEFVTQSEAMQAFEDTYAEHESSYLELAK